MSKAMAKIEKKHGYLSDAMDVLNNTQRGIKDVEKASKQDLDLLEDLGLTTPAVFFTWNETVWTVGYDEDMEGIRLVCVDPFDLVNSMGEKMAKKLGAEYTPEGEEEEEEEEDSEESEDEEDEEEESDEEEEDEESSDEEDEEDEDEDE